MRTPILAAVGTAILLAAACNSTDDSSGSDTLAHSEQCANLATNWGTVPWGDEGAKAEYRHDFETHRFFVNVETPCDFQFEVTQKGTNRHLDLVLAVYDPAGQRIASDDDSGWGRYPQTQISASAIGMYEVRVDAKLPTADDGSVEFVRGKYRVELQCLSELCDVTGAQGFQPAEIDPDLEEMLERVEDRPEDCESGEEGWCTSQSGYGVRYTFNPAYAPSLEEAADQIATDEYAYGHISTNYSRAEFASNLTDFGLTVDAIDAIVGYSDYQVATLEIDDDCSPDYCEGNWWFLQSDTAGETYAIRLGYYTSTSY